MPVKVLIKRRFKEGYVNEINKIIKETRFAAMDQEGYRLGDVHKIISCLFMDSGTHLTF